MKQLLLVFLFFMFSLEIQAQGGGNTYNYIPSEIYKGLINKQFRLIAGENATSNFGSFAGIDLSEAKRVAFSPSFALDTGHLLAFKIGAGYSDGVAEIFKGVKLNSSISFDVDYHFLPRIQHREHGLRKVELTYSIYEMLEIKEKEQAAKDDYRRDLVAIGNDETRYNLIDSLQNERDRLDSLMVEVRWIIDSVETVTNGITPTPAQAQMLNLYKDTLRTLGVNRSIVRSHLNRNFLTVDEWNTRAINRRSRKYAKEIEPYDLINLPISGFKLGWFSIGGGVRKDDFKLYDPTLAYSARIVSEDFISAQLRFKYSFFSWADTQGKNQHTYYWTAGITYSYRSNYLELTSTEMTQTTPLGSDATTQIDKIEKSDVYVGDYKRFIDEVALNGELYWFVGSKNNFAIHTFSNLRIITDDDAIFDAGIGLMYSFKGKEKETTIVNAELYGSLTSAPDDGKVGLRFSFPINFNPKQEKDE